MTMRANQKACGVRRESCVSFYRVERTSPWPADRKTPRSSGDSSGEMPFSTTMDWQRAAIIASMLVDGLSGL